MSRVRRALSRVRRLRVIPRSNPSDSIVSQLITVFFRITGLCLNTPDVPAGGPQPTSQLWLINQIILIIFQTVLTFFIGIPWLIPNELPMDARIKWFEIAEIGMAAIIAVIIWIVVAVGRRKSMKFIERLSNADQLAKEFHEKYSQQPFGIHAVFCVFSYFALLWIPTIWTEWETRYDDDDIYIWFCCYCAPQFIVLMFCILYAFRVKMIRTRMRGLNDTVNKHLSTTKPPIVKTYGSDPAVADFRTWKLAHDELNEAARIISDLYSFPIFYVLAFIQYGIIFNSYYVMKHTDHKNDWVMLMRIVNGLIWNMVLTVSEVMLIFQIETLKGEAKKKSDICKSAIEQFHRFKDLREELKNYSLQMTHQEFAFTAFGCFPVNATLLNSLFVTSISYLVVLYQYQGLAWE